MTDAERMQLLSGVMPFQVQGANSSRTFKGIPAIAGYVQGIPRLGIPDLLETDSSLGVANPMQLRTEKDTALPSSLALAATFDPQMAFETGAMIAAEARGYGYNVLLAGGVNLARDPRNGRNFEYFGEDPLLAGTLAGEAISGIQSQHVLSTIKHFALNDQETLRNTLDARIDQAAFRESDLLAFELAIERGRPGAVMCAYNLVNGSYACGSDQLLNRVLKGEWRFPGWVMSDWGAVHDVAYFNAGLDQESGSQLDSQVWFGSALKEGLVAGRISHARLSDAVRRILRSIYNVGLDSDLPRSGPAPDQHAELARLDAAEGIVLLKNDGILPLTATAHSIAVIGGNADIGVMSGGGSSQVTPVGGPAAIIPVGGTGTMGAFSRQLIVPSSPLAALRAACPQATLTYDSGFDVETAAARAARADVAIVFATKWQMEGYDAGDLDLPQGQPALIAAVMRANPNTIVVLETGNPVRMPWLSGVKAVIEAWYPGQRGGEAIADVLTGAVNPSGRLPITFPANESQLPRPRIEGLGLPETSRITIDYKEGANVGYRWFASTGQKALFPFGFGLSYTSFAASGLTVEGLHASLTVTNTGAQAGATVAQLYLVSRNGEAKERLVGFQRVNLAPGASQKVSLTIDPRLLADWNGGGWLITGGEYGFALGADAEHLGPIVTTHIAQRHWKD